MLQSNRQHKILTNCYTTGGEIAAMRILIMIITVLTYGRSLLRKGTAMIALVCVILMLQRNGKTDPRFKHDTSGAPCLQCRPRTLKELGIQA